MYTQTIERFFASSERAKWLYFKKMSVFVRKSVRAREKDQILQCFDIANVSVVPLYQKQGVFTEFLQECEDLAKKHGFDGIFIECVQNSHLWGFLGRKGYDIFRKDDNFVPHYYKELNEYAERRLSDIRRANLCGRTGP
jgi:GNAT superfamily N-acetyltransferase